MKLFKKVNSFIYNFLTFQIVDLFMQGEEYYYLNNCIKNIKK